MTTAAIIIDLHLLTISTLCTIAMAIAWRDLDHPRHALAWATSFVLLAALWSIDLAGLLGRIDPMISRTLATTMAALASAVYAIGFYRRAAREIRPGLLIATALIPSLCLFALDRIGLAEIGLGPLHLYNTIMLASAAGTLVGRRRSERAAQDVAYVGLSVLSLICAGLFASKLHAALIGHIAAYDWVGTAVFPFLPATVTGIGLVSIFLLAADQAEQTRRLATTDILSGLLNRRGFEGAAEDLLAAARSLKRPVSIALIDIDRFKAINDCFGHQTGDRIIAQFAALLSEQAGRRDLVARLGGEEFVILMADTDAAAAVKAAEMLRERIATTNFHLPDERVVTGSFGIVELNAEHVRLSDLVGHADMALYEAKSSGRNCVALAKPPFSGTAAR